MIIVGGEGDNQLQLHYPKALISALKAHCAGGGGYLISDAPEGLIREGGSFTKSNEMDTNNSSSVLSLHILQIQHTVLRGSNA